MEWRRHSLYSTMSVVLVATACTASPVTHTLAEPGYSVSFVSATPEPGSTLMPNTRVRFAVTVDYDLAVTDSGAIHLVFQDHRGVPLYPQGPQAREWVPRGTGQVTVSDEIVIPRGVNRIYLFVPLVPRGYDQTSGEILIRYSVSSESGHSTGTRDAPDDSEGRGAT